MPLRLRFQPSLITLGTAQLGMAYGVSNIKGQPSQGAALAILDRAAQLGITTIDTARAYGDAEVRIGKWLAARHPAGVNVVTKIPPLPAASHAERRRLTLDYIVASAAALGVRPLPLVMVHEETDLLDPYVVDAFQAAISHGTIAHFGASVYQTSVAEQLIATVPIAALQIPASIADQRFARAGILDAASAKGIAVFARSVFLQGLLLLPPQRVPKHLEAITPLLAALTEAACRSNCAIMEILIPAVRDLPGVTSLVLGLETTRQLEADIEASVAQPIAGDLRAELTRIAARLPPALFSPGQWKTLVGGR